MKNDMTPARCATHEVSPFGRLFDDWFQLAGWPTGDDTERLLTPALDIAETEKAYVVHAELPGVAKDDVTITVEDGTLVLAAQKKREAETKEKGWHRVERAYGSYRRTLALPKGVDADRAEATFQDGVLTIEIPKSEQAKPKTLKVK
jgi:HSP20 family protein